MRRIVGFRTPLAAFQQKTSYAKSPTQIRQRRETLYKHEGRGPLPEIQFIKDHPRRFVGKCPAGMPAQLRQKLLNEAIPGPTGDREIDYPKYLYVVHEGAIYEARTSDAGGSYHAFPYRGKLSRELLEQLRNVAEEKKCLEACDEWIKKHLQIQGGK
jgi:hypothetical protein